MSQNKISIWFVLLLCVACTPKWNDHYDAGQVTVTDKTVWEYLQSCPEYSGFVALVKETGTDKNLESGENLTVWVPGNDRIPDLSALTDSVKRLTVRNHISMLEYTTPDMQNGIRVSAWSGKKIGIFSDDNLSFRVNDSRIVKSDMICRNGVVQEIGGWLDLQDNLKDYLEKAPQYSIIRELIHSVQDSVFDEKNSTPTGELDVMGNPVYDSVFIPVNKFYNLVHLERENTTFTLFLTPDWILQEKIDKHYRSIIGYTGENPTSEDTTKLETWLRNSIPYSGSYYDFTGLETLVSLRNVIWRPAYQTLGMHEEFSNGTVWQLADLYIPRTLIWRAGNSGDEFSLNEIHTNKPVTVTVTGLDPDVTVTGNPVFQCNKNDGYSVVVSPIDEGNQVPFNLDITWTVGKLVSGYFKQITMLPGEYLLEFNFKRTEDMRNDFELYLNDRYVARLKIEDYPNTATKYTVSKIVRIGEEDAETPTRLSLRTVNGDGHALALSALSVRFKQTANNY